MVSLIIQIVPEKSRPKFVSKFLKNSKLIIDNATKVIRVFSELSTFYMMENNYDSIKINIALVYRVTSFKARLLLDPMVRKGGDSENRIQDQ